MTRDLSELTAVADRDKTVSPHREPLREALDRLDNEQRRLVLMYYDGDCPNAETVAKQLGITPDAVRGRVKRIRASLREWIERRLTREEGS